MKEQEIYDTIFEIDRGIMKSIQSLWDTVEKLEKRIDKIEKLENSNKEVINSK